MGCICANHIVCGTKKMKFLVVLWLLSTCAMNIQATTHWMVTESGLIQPRVDSPFEMTRSYDLLAFLNQDTRWDNILNLYHDLSKRQALLDKLWTDIKKKSDMTTVAAKNDDCVRAGQLNFLDWYATFLEDGKSKNIPDEEYMLYKPAYGQDTDVPDCKKISSLTFSMFAFEHLEGMVQRENLTSNPELALPEMLSPIMTVDQFGHWVAVCLRKNSSSWLHYNLASLYWRVRGNAPKAMECSRRAVHYAPREYKDVALLSLGSILHRSKKTEDAITVLGAAVDHDPQYHINHFILATGYAVLGEFNNSLKHFDQCLELNPGFDLAIRYRYGILCHIALWQKMDVIKKIVDKLREELIEYNSREAHWLKSQYAFLRTMKHVKEFDYKNVEKNCEKMSELTGLNFKDLKKAGDKNSVIRYFLDGPVSLGEKLDRKGVYALESVYSLQRLVKHIEKHANMASNFVEPNFNDLTEWESDGQIMKEIGPMPVFPDFIPEIKVTITPASETKESRHESRFEKKSSDNEFARMFDGHFLYPSQMKINRNVEDFDREPDWPSNAFCQEKAQSFPQNVEAIYPVFLPFENKGIRLKSLLTDRIGVSVHEEHELPWHPPSCPHDKEAAAFTNKKSKQQISYEVVDTGYLRRKLLEYVGDGNLDAVMRMQDVEIGHRIYIAMQMKLAPKWVLQTLASLYWRVRGNNANALRCLLPAARAVGPSYRDVVLASLASVYLEMGYFDEALAAAEEAFRISLYEPATNFILAELNMLKKHRNTHMFHLKQAVRVEPRFLGGLARSLLNGWACILRQITSLQDVDLGDGDICTQVEPGVNMVCEKDGTNCHVTNIQCFSSHERKSSTLARMLELKELKGSPKGKETSADHMDDSMFDAFIENMPKDRTDKFTHQQNYEMMIRSVDTALKGCGPRGCHDIQPEDLSLKDEDCTFQHLQIGYWLHIINFRQLLLDSANLRVPSEITSITPSSKKIPECRLPVDPMEDFYLERISRVDTDGWEPVLSLMHQFAEVFDFYDYVTLGAKIAKYVENRPKWWVGLAAAGWWCGAGGRGACAARCLAAAHALAPAAPAPAPGPAPAPAPAAPAPPAPAPPAPAPHALRALAALLHLQHKTKDAKDVSYLSFYTTPKNKIDAFLVGVSHTNQHEYEQAVWMYRYALTFDDKFLPAKACLHATMCLMLFGDPGDDRAKHT